MEFFTVPCPGKGEVSIDGSPQGKNKDGKKLHPFQCNDRLHDISMTCLNGKQCQEPVQRVMITGANPILPQKVPFVCRKSHSGGNGN